MPGFDGTGPRGLGPMTGGGRGFCAIPLSGSWPTYLGRGAYPHTVYPGVCLTMEHGQLLQVLCRLPLR